MHNLKLISFNMVDSLEGLGLPELDSLRQRVKANAPQDKEALADDLRKYGLAMVKRKIIDALAQGRVNEILNALPGTEEPWMPDMVDVAGGTFKMGGAKHDDEKLIRDVTLSDYRIGRDPVTNAQYARFIEEGGYTNQEYWSDAGWAEKKAGGAFKRSDEITCPKWWESGKYNSGPKYPNHPVVGVNWYEAQAYCRWLAEKKGTDVRLA
ncbi:MAG: SUMF1/EgtB/PvdO family nonheme iron enzyme, partial [Candidatus Saganbacteria bacterium]|nr:SUMF1/EgtB/PvdO family nonheme iron enzyme [Candidatus Saganbacteria bacterium]